MLCSICCLSWKYGECCSAVAGISTPVSCTDISECKRAVLCSFLPSCWLYIFWGVLGFFFGQHLHSSPNSFSHTPFRACHGFVAAAIHVNTLFAVTMILCLPALNSHKLLAVGILCLVQSNSRCACNGMNVSGKFFTRWVIITVEMYGLVPKCAAVGPEHYNVTFSCNVGSMGGPPPEM